MPNQHDKIAQNSEAQNSEASDNTNTHKLTKEEIQDWLVSYLAQLLEIKPEEVDVKANFNRYGLDSSAAVALLSDLSDQLGREIEPDSLYYYPTIELLAKYLDEVEEILL